MIVEVALSVAAGAFVRWLARGTPANDAPAQGTPSAPSAPRALPSAPSPAPKLPAAPRFASRAEDIVLPGAWVRLSSGALVPVEPPRDRSTGGFAKGNYAANLALARANGGELLTREDMIALSELARGAGTELDVVALPDLEQMRAAGVDPADKRAVQALRVANMSGRAWSDWHDARAQAQIDKLRAAGKWDGSSVPLANVGKVWIAGAPPGRAYLMGWRLKNGVWIQSGATEGNGPHDDQHSDYSSVLMFKRAA